MPQKRHEVLISMWTVQSHFLFKLSTVLTKLPPMVSVSAVELVYFAPTDYTCRRRLLMSTIQLDAFTS